MNDVDVTPVRDHHGGQRRPYANGDLDQDPEVKQFDQYRLVVAQFSRDDLEDKYLRLYEDYLILKKHERKQEEKIKKLAAKLMRLVNDRKHGGGGPRQFAVESRVEELEERVTVLDRQNRQLKDKLQLSKQQLSSQGRRHTPYDHVQSRINSGVGARPGSAPGEGRPKSSARATNRGDAGGGLNTSGGMPRYGHSLLEEARAENRRLEQIIKQLHEQIFIHEQSIEEHKEQVRLKEAEFEEDVLRIKQQASSGQRLAIQENMDLIKLQRELKEKSSLLTAVHAKYQALEAKMATAEASHAQLMREMDRQGAELKLKEQQGLQLETDLKQLHSAQRRILEMEHQVEDLRRDNDVLRDANEKLTSSAFDTAREREWREKEQALRTQIAQLEATMKRDVGEKGEALGRLEQERDRSDLAEHELSALRVRLYELQQQYDEMADKMKFFTKESAVDLSEIEEALVLVKQKREKGVQSLAFLTQVDEESGQDVRRRLQEAEAAHAETIQELEKTRGMLVVQYKINNDYKRELEAVQARSEQTQAEAELKLSEYARLLDIRAARVRRLQLQLKDVAYGTRQFRVTAAEAETEDDADSVATDDSVALQRGENLVEIHVGKLVLNERALSALDESEPQLFCTWDFFEFETQATAVLRGPAPDFDLTAQYTVRVDDFFLHHLQKDATVLELHQVVGSEYRTLAACRLSLRELLESRRGRVHGTAQLLAAQSEAGPGLGSVEYWVRLRVPMEQALRLYRERTKALGYLNTNERATGEALRALDDQAAQRPDSNVNSLHVKVVRCQGVKARRSDLQPSVYCVYKFFDFPDHDTSIIPASQAPEFHDHRAFPVHMTGDLDRYLKTQPLQVFLFDDTDPEEAAFLGRAEVPLIPLAHNKPVSGAFELAGPGGAPCGVVEVSLQWQHPYAPGHLSARTETLEATAAAMARAPGAPAAALSSVELLPGEEEELRPVGLPAHQTRPERDLGPQRGSPSALPPPKAAPKAPPSRDAEVRSPPMVAIQAPGKSILKRPAPQKEGTVAQRLKQMPESLLPRLDDMDVPSDSVVSTEVEEDAVVPDKPVDRSRDQRAAVQASIESLTRTGPSELTTITDSQTVTSVTRDDGYGWGVRQPKASESGSSDAAPLPVGTNSRGPIAPPRQGRQGRRGSGSENGSDSDAVVVASSTRGSQEATLRDSGGSASGAAGPADTAVVEVVHLQLEDEAALLKDPQVKYLYVEYDFLRTIVETPISLPKPAHNAHNKKLTFNFRKSFAVDFDGHYEQRQWLASMLLENYPGSSNFIAFTVISEPSDEESSADCIDQGYAELDIRRVLREGRDVENLDIPVTAPGDEKTVIGSLCISVRCLAALRAISEEMADAEGQA